MSEQSNNSATEPTEPKERNQRKVRRGYVVSDKMDKTESAIPNSETACHSSVSHFGHPFTS